VEVRAGVAAVVAREDRFLLIRRGKAPSKGLWAFPGGSIMPGEPLVTAAIRELAEETGVVAANACVLAAVDIISSPGAAVPYHFVLIPVLLRWVSGEAVAADDAEAAGWFTRAQMHDLDTVPTLWPVLADAEATLLR
jgi:8-oxo-dGTP diphosphatase